MIIIWTVHHDVVTCTNQSSLDLTALSGRSCS
jgi:hypothetical protein